MKNEIQDDEKKRLREIYYSSLLEQRKENESNRIKIAVISVGITVAGSAGTIIGKGIQPFSNPLLLLLMMLIGYVPWLYLLYVVFHKLKIDDKVIDEKIATIGTAKEYADTKSKGPADELEGRFRRSLIIALIGIICMPICILISTLFIGGKEMSKKEITKESVIHTVDDRRSTHEGSYGGKLPGVFQPDHADPNETPDPPKEVTTPQSSVPDKPNQDTNQETKTESNQ